MSAKDCQGRPARPTSRRARSYGTPVRRSAANPSPCAANSAATASAVSTAVGPVAGAYGRPVSRAASSHPQESATIQLPPATAASQPARHRYPGPRPRDHSPASRRIQPVRRATTTGSWPLRSSPSKAGKQPTRTPAAATSQTSLPRKKGAKEARTRRRSRSFRPSQGASMPVPMSAPARTNQPTAKKAEQGDGQGLHGGSSGLVGTGGSVAGSGQRVRRVRSAELLPPRRRRPDVRRGRGRTRRDRGGRAGRGARR
ncbi:hypothetical protein STANM309S_04576 [Streptomyces tanashiensis]